MCTRAHISVLASDEEHDKNCIVFTHRCQFIARIIVRSRALCDYVRYI